MTDDKLKAIIELFAKSLMSIGRAINYDEQNKSQARDRIKESDKHLSNIIDIISDNTIEGEKGKEGLNMNGFKIPKDCTSGFYCNHPKCYCSLSEKERNDLAVDEMGNDPL
jgi:hypothetical protein